MAISEAFTGSNASWGTEFSLTNASTTLASQTTDGMYQLFVLFPAAMTSSDTYTVKIYEKVRGADAQGVVVSTPIIGTGAVQVWAFPALLLMNGWDMSITATAGTTTRTVTWSIRSVA